jgi:micrococcal nuclease
MPASRFFEPPLPDLRPPTGLLRTFADDPPSIGEGSFFRASWLMPSRTLLLLATLALGAHAADPPSPGPAAVTKATVTKVSDGDSIEVRTESGNARVRLSAVDSPEYDQPYATQSTAALRALLPLGTTVELEVVTQDSFRRLVAVVWRDSEGQRVNINETLLSEGHAWAYRRYMRDPKYCELEAAARDRKAGLWAQPVTDWVYPPEWRFLKNGEIRTLPAAYAETREKCLEVLGKAGAGTYTPPN